VSWEIATSVAAVGGSALGVAVAGFLILRLVSEPWRRLADESARRAAAEIGRDYARDSEQRWATAAADKDREIRELRRQIDDSRARVLPGTGTLSLQDGVDAEDAERAAAGTADGDGPVPRVTASEPVTRGPRLPG